PRARPRRHLAQLHRQPVRRPGARRLAAPAELHARTPRPDQHQRRLTKGLPPFLRNRLLVRGQVRAARGCKTVTPFDGTTLEWIGCRARRPGMVAVFKYSPHHPAMGYEVILTLALAIIGVAAPTPPCGTRSPPQLGGQKG